MNRNTRLFIWGLIKLAWGVTATIALIFIIMDGSGNWATWLSLAFSCYILISGYLDVNKTTK